MNFLSYLMGQRDRIYFRVPRWTIASATAPHELAYVEGYFH